MERRMTEEKTTESPQKWWASGGDIPTIEEVVGRLRAEGNLDEKKWLNLQKHMRKLKLMIYSISAFLLLGAVYEMSVFSFLFVGAIVYYLVAVILENSLKEWGVLTPLFSNGIRHKAHINDVAEVGWPRSITSGLIIESTLNLGGNDFKETILIPLTYIERKDFPKSGDEIEVIYDKENPFLFRFYNKKLNDLYCLNNNRNGAK